MYGAAELVLLADSGEAKKAGPLALAIILVLFVACYFLFRSMSRHLRKVRTEFPVGAPRAEPPAGGVPSKPADGADEHAAGSPGPADSASPSPHEISPPETSPPLE
jgi:hypothetical protein